MMMPLLFIVISSLAWAGINAEASVSTLPEVVGLRGKHVDLPCDFKTNSPPDSVFWHHINSTGERVVARFFARKFESVVPGYDISGSYSLSIPVVEVAHEANYSCTVAFADFTDGRNFTSLRVVAIAVPLVPTVTDCEPRSTGDNTSASCEYVLPDVAGDAVKFQLTCQISDVRPPVDLSWSSITGTALASQSDVVEDNGLYNVTSTLQVSESQIGDDLKCIASGEAVDGSSSVIVSVAGPPPPAEGGLSGGAIFAIILFCVILPLGVAIGVFFYWRRKKIKEVPFKSECEILQEQIKQYKPGALSPLEDREGRQLPTKTRLAVFGVTSAGKSSLVRSFRYAVEGDYIPVEIAQTQAAGGVTIAPKPYKITENVSFVDNRGLRDLDEKLVVNIMKQIQGKDDNLHPGNCIDCPILVFDARQPMNALETFLPTFVEAIRKEYATHPPVVFTHEVEVGSRKDSIVPKATGLGALDQRLFFVENFTDQPEQPDYERILKFLRILKKLLELADENMIQRVDSRARGTEPNAASPMLAKTASRQTGDDQSESKSFKYRVKNFFTFK